MMTLFIIGLIAYKLRNKRFFRIAKVFFFRKFLAFFVPKT
jgi:hypothetical protein